LPPLSSCPPTSLCPPYVIASGAKQSPLPRDPRLLRSARNDTREQEDCFVASLLAMTQRVFSARRSGLCTTLPLKDVRRRMREFLVQETRKWRIVVRRRRSDFSPRRYPASSCFFEQKTHAVFSRCHSYRAETRRTPFSIHSAPLRLRARFSF